MTMLDFATEVMTQPRAVAIAALDAAVLALWSNTGGWDAATRADYSTGRAAYGFSTKEDLLAQLLVLNLEVAATIERGLRVTGPRRAEEFSGPRKIGHRGLYPAADVLMVSEPTARDAEQ